MASVLLVECDRNQRLLLTEELEYEGYDVIAVGGAEEAIKMLSMRQPDIVVLEARLPNMHGLELIRRISQVDSDVPVVVHTASAGLEGSRTASAADAYVLKRSDMSDLSETLRRLLGANEPSAGTRLARAEVAGAS